MRSSRVSREYILPRPIDFETLPPNLPAWMDAWPTAFKEHFRTLLQAYRSRVEQHYAEEHNQFPDRFILSNPVEVVAIAAVTAIWVFARGAAKDGIRVYPVWNDVMLADWEFMEIPEDRRITSVAQQFLSGNGWSLLEEIDLCSNGWASAFSEVPHFYDSAGKGRLVADEHAGDIAFNDLFSASVKEAMKAHAIDEKVLARVREGLSSSGRLPCSPPFCAAKCARDRELHPTRASSCSPP